MTLLLRPCFPTDERRHQQKPTYKEPDCDSSRGFAWTQPFVVWGFPCEVDVTAVTDARPSTKILSTEHDFGKGQRADPRSPLAPLLFFSITGGDVADDFDVPIKEPLERRKIEGARRAHGAGASIAETKRSFGIIRNGLRRRHGRTITFLIQDGCSDVLTRSAVARAWERGFLEKGNGGTEARFARSRTIFGSQFRIR